MTELRSDRLIGYYALGRVNEHDWAALWLIDWLLRIRAWQIFRENYFYK